MTASKLAPSIYTLPPSVAAAATVDQQQPLSLCPMYCHEEKSNYNSIAVGIYKADKSQICIPAALFTTFKLFHMWCGEVFGLCQC